MRENAELERRLETDPEFRHAYYQKESNEKLQRMIKSGGIRYFPCCSIFNPKIKIDGSGDRIFRKRFLNYLTRQLNTEQKRIVKNCKLANSKNNVLIQMTDMIAGSVRRSFDESRKDATTYKNIIRKHIEDEWHFK